MSASQLGITYGERWDAQRRTIGGPLAPELARGLHDSGKPYAVLLGGTERPRVVLEVDGHSALLSAWCLDEQLRRTFLYEFNMFGTGWMTVIRVAEWQYPDVSRPEFDPTSPRRLTTFVNAREPLVKSLDADGAVFREITSWHRGCPEPRFGDWAQLVGFVLDELRPAAAEPDAAPRQDVELSDEWPPGARRPGPEVPAMFGSPARFAVADRAEQGVVVEAREVGHLAMPTGRLVATDPGWLSHDELEPFSRTLPPGRHAVTVAVARFEKGGRRVAGCRVTVRDAPAVSWVPAVRPDQYPSTLGDGAFFGIGVDAGMLCFFDAAAAPQLVEISEMWDRDGRWEDLCDTADRDDIAIMAIPGSEANLVAFPSGWGDGAYPVWIGLGADGEVVCVVADTLVLSGASYVGAADQPPPGDWSPPLGSGNPDVR